MVKMKGINKQHYLYQEDLKYILGIDGFDFLRGKSLLITGATGLIGVCLIDAIMAFNKQGAKITVYAVGRSKENAQSRLGEYYDNEFFFFIEQDVRQPLPPFPRLDYIIPLASNTHPLAYSKYPIETIEINVKGTEFALQRASDCGAAVIYPSTVEVYGNSIDSEVFSEDSTGKLNLSNARACYTESKRLCEALCQSYIAEKGAIVKIVRLSRVFGPTMIMSDSKASSQFIINAINSEDIVLKSRGEQFFSYTYVADVVAALLFVLLHGENGVPYNIANDNCNVHLRDFAQTCAKIAGTKVVFCIPSLTEQKGYSVASRAIIDNARLRQLGYVPSYSFEDALIRTISILKSV